MCFAERSPSSNKVLFRHGGEKAGTTAGDPIPNKLTSPFPYSTESKVVYILRMRVRVPRVEPRGATPSRERRRPGELPIRHLFPRNVWLRNRRPQNVTFRNTPEMFARGHTLNKRHTVYSYIQPQGQEIASSALYFTLY